MTWSTRVSQVGCWKMTGDNAENIGWNPSVQVSKSQIEIFVHYWANDSQPSQVESKEVK